MANTSRTEPELRFTGYTDAWEQRKLTEISELITVGIANSATHAYSSDGVVMFRNQNIKANYLDDSDLIHITESFEKNYINKRLKSDDLLIARTGYPGTACVVPHKYEGSQTFTTLIARLKKDIVNPLFVCQYINSDIGKKYFESTQIGGGQKNSGAGILGKMPIGIPKSLPEQNKIASFMSLLDSTITLYQRKCDGLLLFKKSMLQKMFPQDGETEPKVRFAGYTDNWELRKFGEILIEFSNKTKIENEYPVLSSTNTGMEFRDGRVSGISNVGYKIIDYNDLVLSPQNLWLGNININNIGIGIVSPSYKTYKLRDIEIDFFRPQIRTTNLMNEYFNSSIQGASVVRRNLDVEKFNDISIFVPSSSEQVAIGSLFSNLDNTITLHQRKLEQLKTVKQFLLQKMFV